MRLFAACAVTRLCPSCPPAHMSARTSTSHRMTLCSNHMRCALSLGCQTGGPRELRVWCLVNSRLPTHALQHVLCTGARRCPTRCPHAVVRARAAHQADIVRPAAGRPGGAAAPYKALPTVVRALENSVAAAIQQHINLRHGSALTVGLAQPLLRQTRLFNAPSWTKQRGDRNQCAAAACSRHAVENAWALVMQRMCLRECWDNCGRCHGFGRWWWPDPLLWSSDVCNSMVRPWALAGNHRLTDLHQKSCWLLI